MLPFGSEYFSLKVVLTLKWETDIPKIGFFSLNVSPPHSKRRRSNLIPTKDDKTTQLKLHVLLWYAEIRTIIL